MVRTSKFVRICKNCWKIQKIRNALNDLQITIKSIQYTLTTYTEVYILVCFALRPAIFEIQGFFVENQKNRKCME